MAENESNFMAMKWGERKIMFGRVRGPRWTAAIGESKGSKIWIQLDSPGHNKWVASSAHVLCETSGRTAQEALDRLLITMRNQAKQMHDAIAFSEVMHLSLNWREDLLGRPARQVRFDKDGNTWVAHDFFERPVVIRLGMVAWVVEYGKFKCSGDNPQSALDSLFDTLKKKDWIIHWMT